MRTRVGHLLLALYPEPWRARYGEEMRALMEDDPPGTRGFASLLRGAAQSHLRPQRSWRRGLPPESSMRLSVGGLFACWILVSLAGACFAKETEHMDAFEHMHPLLSAARGMIIAGAALGAVAVAVGGLPLLWHALVAARRRRDRKLAWMLASPALAAGALAALAVVLVPLAPARGARFPAVFVLSVPVPLALGALAWALVAALAPKAVMRRAEPPARLLRLACLSGQALALATLLVAGGLLLYVPALWSVAGAGTAASGPFGASTRVTLCLALAAAVAAGGASLLSAVRAGRAALAR
jgi:hypothetical protein